jgi:SAM-dependent methyltransferase
MNISTPYPHLKQVSTEFGVSEDALVKIFLLERQFHQAIMSTESGAERVRQYDQLYAEVYRLWLEGAYGGARGEPSESHVRLVHMFRRELTGKTLLELGCGDGQFLDSVSRLLPHGELCGMDTSDVAMPQSTAGRRFLKQSVVDFKLDRKFDIVYSHQVLEHIAPADLPVHLRSVHSVLKSGGRFICILPNKYWGPQDITRIVDNTFSGRLPAMGSHLNESSYTELVPQLKAVGFANVKTVLPFAAFLPILRSVRVRPWLNQLVERNSAVRKLVKLVRWNGRPLFKNPVILICEKP